MKLLMALALTTCAPVYAYAQTVAADTPGKTASGVQYVQPKDWTASKQGPALIFTSPETDLRIVVADIGAAADAKDAVAKAWAAFRPDGAPTLRNSTPASPGDGWEERVGFSYETLPTERATRSATALRKGTGWTVLIVDGSAGTAAKRSAAMSVVSSGLRPAGFQKETFAGKTAHELTPDRVKVILDFVEKSRQALEVPGVGFALIDNGKVLWQGGFGVRALGSPEKVDARTKFMIASNTKGLTLLLSVLADEGKLRWDEKVTDLYPDFRLGNDEVTKSVLVRHLICACTGLPRKDYGFILADKGSPASATFTQLAATMPTSKFGELFQYNNQLASAAGYIGGHILYPKMEFGAAYDRAMSEKIFKPLGMKDSTFDYAKGMAGDFASPHGLDIDGKVTRMSNDFNWAPYPYRPAGAAFSTTADMVHYVQLELGKGMLPSGKRVVSEVNILKRREKGVQVGPTSWYGMGLFQQDVAGVQVVTHGGTLQGFHSNWYALPESGVGLVILTNSDTGPQMFGPLLRRLLEVLYDGKPEAERDIAAASARMKTQAPLRRSRLTYPGDPAVLGNLAGHYSDPTVGQITISEKGGQKWIKAGFVEGPIATRKNADGSLSIISVAPGNIGVEALVGTKDGKRTLTVNDGQQTQYVYIED